MSVIAHLLKFLGVQAADADRDEQGDDRQPHGGHAQLFSPGSGAPPARRRFCRRIGFCAGGGRFCVGSGERSLQQVRTFM